MAYEITDFDIDVLKRSNEIPVLVDFWAEWCGPCKTLGPILEKLAEQNTNRWALAKIDTDKHQDLAAKYGIRGIPTVKLFIAGNVVNEFTGALPEQAIVRWLERALPGRFEKEIGEAEKLLAEDQIDKGRAILEKVVASEPENHEALVLLGNSYLHSDPEKAAKLVEKIEEDSKLFLRAEGIRTFATLTALLNNPDSLPDDLVKQNYLSAIKSLSHHHYDEALKGFIDVIRENRYYDDDGPRKACIAIFKILGEDHDITQKHRRDFGSALNV